jgi:hypothetical protein
MKKYFLGCTAIVLAIAFSSFTTKFADVDFYLTTDPTSPGVVAQEHNWRSDANPVQFGNCSSTPADLACKITIDVTTMSSYVTGSAGAGYQLKGSSDSGNFLTITEGLGKDLGNDVFDRVITSITKSADGSSVTTFTNAKE